MISPALGKIVILGSSGRSGSGTDSAVYAGLAIGEFLGIQQDQTLVREVTS